MYAGLGVRPDHVPPSGDLYIESGVPHSATKEDAPEDRIGVESSVTFNWRSYELLQTFDETCFTRLRPLR